MSSSVTSVKAAADRTGIEMKPSHSICVSEHGTPREHGVTLSGTTPATRRTWNTATAVPGSANGSA